MSKQYFTTIGLEIHAELDTNSKMFCGCINNPDTETPNTNICPVCMAHPGSLPVANKKAIEYVIRVGLALDSEIANFIEFDRKNYFYPDIPKGYQISQYKYPIVSGGELDGVKITRIHLEEDTATSRHGSRPEVIEGQSPSTGSGQEVSLLDFNRAGVQLMELVTEPVIHSAKEAVDFAKELQILLRYLGVSHANMEKGEMRVELNISISPDKNKFGTKVEVKNINSFKAVERAAEYEIKRMSELYEDGKESEIVQETRGWDEGKQMTFSQRSKENSEDYRYFPEPDLPKFYLHEVFDLEKMKKELPELPEDKRFRYIEDFGLKLEDIESYITDRELGVWFELVVKELHNDKNKIKIASNYVTSDLLGLKNSGVEVKFPNPVNFAELISMAVGGEISSRATKDILAMIVVKDESPMHIAKTQNLLQKNDEGMLAEIVQKIIDANPAVVATYKSGKENAIMSLVGKVMGETKGSANPQIVQKLLKEMIK